LFFPEGVRLFSGMMKIENSNLILSLLIVFGSKKTRPRLQPRSNDERFLPDFRLHYLPCQENQCPLSDLNITREMNILLLKMQIPEKVLLPPNS